MATAINLWQSEMPNPRLLTAGITSSTLRCMALALVLFCYSLSVTAQTHCWTTVGSAGTVDEADMGNVALSAVTTAVKNSVANTTVDIRYNVVAVEGIFGGEQKMLTVRFADNGAAAQVIVRLRQLNISNGVQTTLAELNSNDFPQSPVAQAQSMVFNCQKPEFDFVKNVYYIEVELIKTGAGGNPLIRAIQICGGVVC